MGGSIRFLEAGRSIVAYGIRAHPTDLEYVHCAALFAQVSHYHSRQIREGSKCIRRPQPPLMADSFLNCTLDVCFPRNIFPELDARYFRAANRWSRSTSDYRRRTTGCY